MKVVCYKCLQSSAPALFFRFENVLTLEVTYCHCPLTNRWMVTVDLKPTQANSGRLFFI